MPSSAATGRVRQTAYVVSRSHKLAALSRILDIEDPSSAIVFCRTRTEVDQLTETLTARIDATVEHLDQTNKWLSEMDEFKDLVGDMPSTELRVGYQATAPPLPSATASAPTPPPIIQGVPFKKTYSNRQGQKG